MNLTFPVDVRPVVRTIPFSATTVVWVWAEDETSLRELLEREVAIRSGRRAEDVEIISRPRMKPIVKLAGNPSAEWQVSLSRTHRGCAGTLAFGRAIGIDVEWIDPEFPWESVAAEFFSPEIVETWKQGPPDEARREFYRHWVRWEAALKCRGTGFGGRHRSAATATQGLDVFELDLKAGYVGCVALASD